MLAMPRKPSQHFGAEVAEKYSLGNLSAAKVAEIEEHLLICEACRQAVDASDEYVAAMRKAAVKLRDGEQKLRRRIAGK
jgi:anti-sigma factor RsiW